MGIHVPIKKLKCTIQNYVTSKTLNVTML